MNEQKLWIETFRNSGKWSEFFMLSMKDGTIERLFPNIYRLQDCPNDTKYHIGEPNVIIHMYNNMVKAEKAGETDKDIYEAIFWHDQGKYETSEIKEETAEWVRVTAYNHERVSETLLRYEYVLMDYPKQQGEVVLTIVGLHMIPHFMIDSINKQTKQYYDNILLEIQNRNSCDKSKAIDILHKVFRHAKYDSDRPVVEYEKLIELLNVYYEKIIV